MAVHYAFSLYCLYIGRHYGQRCCHILRTLDFIGFWSFSAGGRNLLFLFSWCCCYFYCSFGRKIYGTNEPQMNVGTGKRRLLLRSWAASNISGCLFYDPEPISKFPLFIRTLFNCMHRWCNSTTHSKRYSRQNREHTDLYCIYMQPNYLSLVDAINAVRTQNTPCTFHYGI